MVPAGARPWDGLKVLVTAGGTREPIDAVRYVGNRSSGRMGFAVAEEAAALGAEVTVIAANVTLARHPRVRYVEVETAAQLRDAAIAEFPAADVLVMAAAVADFRPASAIDGKVKKTGRDELELVLERTEDVLSGLAATPSPRADARRLCRRTWRGRGASTAVTSWSARGWMRWWSTTSPSPASASTPSTTR